MDIAAAVAKSQMHSADVGGVGHIKFDPYTGRWSFGKDNEDICDAVVTLITDSIQHGWHLWVDREVEKTMTSFINPLPERLPSRRDRKEKMQDANEARGIQAVLEDEDGVQLSWEHSTVGCRQCIDKIMTAIRARAVSDPAYLYPVAILTHDTPYANKHGKDGEMLYPPMMEIIGWRDRKGQNCPDAVPMLEGQALVQETAAEDSPLPDEDYDPQAAEAAASAPEPEQTPDVPEPEAAPAPGTRRRRRRA
jgi:hypothetical protein